MVDTPQPVFFLLVGMMFIPFHLEFNKMSVDLLQPHLAPDAVNTPVSYGNIEIVGQIGLPQAAIIIPCPGKDISNNVFCPFFIPKDVERAKEQL